MQDPLSSLLSRVGDLLGPAHSSNGCPDDNGNFHLTTHHESQLRSLIADLTSAVGEEVVELNFDDQRQITA